MKRYIAITAVILAGIVGVPSVARAAVLYFVPPAQPVCQGSTFTVDLLLDSPFEPINAGQVDVSFDPTIVQVQSIDRDVSVFRFWAEGPEFDNAAGTIHMIGGRPTPGFQGIGALVVRVTMQAHGFGASEVQFSPTSEILLDSGFGVFTGIAFSSPPIPIVSSTDPSCIPPKPLLRTPPPTPTPLVCPEAPVCAFLSDTGQEQGLRTCIIEIECTSAPSRTIVAFIPIDDPTQCPLTTRCQEDLSRAESRDGEPTSDIPITPEDVFRAPLRTFSAVSRGVQLLLLLAGIGLGVLLASLAHVIYKLRNRSRPSPLEPNP